ncbi:MAG TPA: hypothetical protein VMZ71_05500, partial [Gemmataceae bacterium]|nr:hypothetical protein [Gemmataceae bacterium]
MCRTLLTLAVAVVLPRAAVAQTHTWNGPYTGTTNWSAGSWTGGTPASGGGTGVILNFGTPL